MTKKEDVKKTKDVEVKQSKVEQELQNTKNELEEIKKMLQTMALNKNDLTIKNEVEVQENEYDEYVDIPANKYIKVISLTNHQLVLTTQPNGQGKSYIFNRFGDARNIIFSDLQDVVHNQERFAREGKFYIADKHAIRVLGLELEYDKLLDRKGIESILTFDNETISSIFSSATIAQKEAIVSLLVGKIKMGGENIDLNKVDVISRVCGKNIIEMARPEKEEIEE